MPEGKYAGQELRKYLRLETFFDVWYSVVGRPEETRKACCVDLTREGCKLVSHDSLPMGLEVELKMKIPSDPVPIFATGQVVWTSQQSADLFAAGLRIVQIQPLDRFKLLDYVCEEWLKMKREKKG